ncbi:uncharacterized protein PODANS_1_50 [Podospora anserina S mat+]|uniref:Podospora anserina S mat+ genomic DNA chromosome 1, supercontig 1 n=1 Tax=Podospora anserina (strain S / ATCC MYA-4624 / DSM 980 / FGSC 10383) TaxID=515849 RepID=B2A9L2_PODAN|nr:uncharacterized protein PODANS_1_50 [Podospora anserina S mat+]CAP59759.1 unnamed protein product [Podospora anserina S mat+]CDP22403.1 Putative protein of unknown function [Podospora anserina S mat+]
MFNVDVPDNTKSPENIASNVILASVLAPVFAIIFVVLRLYTARSILRVSHKDDWLILIAVILSVLYSATLIAMTKFGLGYHIFYLFHSNTWRGKTLLLLAGFPAAITSNLSVLFIKCSILVFYLRFSTTRILNHVIYVMLVIVVIANSLAAFGVLFTCQPMSSFWDGKVKGTCINRDAWYAWLVILNCVTDFILLVLPLWLLAPLKIGFSQKAAIAAILGTGGFVVGISIFRVVVVSQGWDKYDFTYRFAINYIWSVIETNVAIICACAPTLRALVGRYVPSLLQFSARRDPLALYTIPVSHVAAAQRPRPAPRSQDDEIERSSNHENYVSGSSAQLTSNFGSKLFGPASDRASSRGKSDHTAS